jgi:tetratricopeptide (TPR) repeat protein
MPKRNQPPRYTQRITHHKKTESSALGLGYEVTNDPIIDETSQRLPRPIKDELEAIHSELTPWKLLKKDSTTLSRLEELVEKYPKVPRIGNYLTAAYEMVRHPKLEPFIQENYNRNPDYLFARIHYAELCIKRKEFDKIKTIFKEGLDLKLLYPQRKRFHTSEFAAFSNLLCRYYIKTGDRQAAETALKNLETIAADHPGTKNARRIVGGNFIVRFIRKLFGG